MTEMKAGAELDRLTSENERLLREVDRLTRHAREVWSECEARGEILDELQTEAGAGWWYGAKYELQRLKKEGDELRTLACERNRAWRDANREVNRLEVIVEKLPRTADGVPIVPGMEVFRRTTRGTAEPHVVFIVKAEHWVSDDMIHFGPKSPIYSTRDAALASPSPSRTSAASEEGSGR